MSAGGKLNQKQVDKLVDKAARSGVAALLEVMDKHRGSRALAGQALGRMLSSPLDQVCVSLTVLPARYYHAWGSVHGNWRMQRGGAVPGAE